MGRCNTPDNVVWKHRSKRHSMNLRMNALRTVLTSNLLESQGKMSKKYQQLIKTAQDFRLTPSQRTGVVKMINLECSETNPVQVFDEKFKELRVFGEPATLVMVENLISPQKNVYAVDSACCAKCNSEVRFDQYSHQLVCQYCGYCTTSIFITRDYSDDIVANKRYAKTTHNQEQKSNIKICTLSSKIEGFRKWLSQFSQDAQPTPIHVMDVLYRELAHVHVIASAKCRPTHIATVLKMYGFKHELSSTIRITMECNGYVVPKLDTQTTERMIGRYAEIIFVETNDCALQKSTFEFICTLIFYAEGKPEYLSTIFIQKSRNVLRLGDDRVVSLLRSLKANHTKFDWTNLINITGMR